MDKYLVVFAIIRSDGVLIEHKYAHLSRSDAQTQIMAINSQISDLINDDFDAHYKVAVIKECGEEELNLA